MTAPTKKHARRRVFVDRGVQGALARRLFLHWLLFLTALAIVLPIWQILVSGALNKPFPDQVRGVWLQTAPAFILLILLLPSFLWDTIKLSHRFAGPMYRLRSEIRKAANGEHVAPFEFRRGDFWKDVALDFNRLIDRLEDAERRAAEAEQAREDEAVVAGAGD